MRFEASEVVSASRKGRNTFKISFVFIFAGRAKPSMIHTMKNCRNSSGENRNNKSGSTLITDIKTALGKCTIERIREFLIVLPILFSNCACMGQRNDQSIIMISAAIQLITSVSFDPPYIDAAMTRKAYKP